MGIARESKTFKKMLRIYCENHHASPLCADCMALFERLEETLAKCPFGDNKPPCSKCSTDCVGADDRAKIVEVMHYSGPRMLYRYPVLTIAHLFDLLKQKRETL